MSRIGYQPVEIPEDVDVEIDGGTLRADGPVGTLEEELSGVVDVEVDDGEIVVTRSDDSRQSKSHHGLVRSLIANMVEGVGEGFSRELEINGVGYRAEQYGDYIRFDLGLSHPILFELPDQVTVEIEDQTELKLTSPDKELLGQISAKIRNLRPPEPYKGKGIKYKDETIRRKVGKAGVSA